MALYDEGTAMLKKAAAQKRKGRRRGNQDRFAEIIRKRKGDSGNYDNLDKAPGVRPDRPGEPTRRITPVKKHPLIPDTMPHVTPDKPGDRKRVIRPVPGPPKSNVPSNPRARENAVRNYLKKR